MAVKAGMPFTREERDAPPQAIATNAFQCHIRDPDHGGAIGGVAARAGRSQLQQLTAATLLLLLLLVASCCPTASAASYSHHLAHDFEVAAESPCPARPSSRGGGAAAASSPRLGPTFLVLGQQKSGTSTLWNYLLSHPDVDSSASKETLFFLRNRRNASDCGRRLSAYVRRFDALYKAGDVAAAAAAERQRGGGSNNANNNNGSLPLAVGDFSATHLSCACCPRLFARLAPCARLVVLLREPLGRALSRAREQGEHGYGRAPWKPAVLAARDAAGLAAAEVARVSPCLHNAVALSAGAPARRAYLRARCLEATNFFGWSAYAPLLENWLAAFPPEQLLVLYTSELNAQPREVLRRVEDHLGLARRRHTYPDELLATAFNTHKHRGWRSGSNSSSDGGGGDEEEEGDGGTNNTTHLTVGIATLAAEAALAYGWALDAAAVGRVTPLVAGEPAPMTLEQYGALLERPASPLELGDLSGARAWLAPFNARLLAMADAGLIRRPPPGFFAG